MSNYNVTLETAREEVSARFMDAGIHENVELTKIESGTSPNGNKFLAFYFKNEAGEVGSHTEWESTNTDPTKQAEKELNQISRIKQIATCFLSANDFVFQAANFEQFAAKVVSLLTPRIIGVKVRTKFVYPKENSKFTSLPSYWKFRFIERMDNNGYYGEAPKEKSNVKVLSMDRLVRPTADAVASVTPNPFAQAAAVGTPSPF